MCKFCENEEIIINQEIISESAWGWGGDTRITLSEVSTDNFGLFIDKRDSKTFMRFADIEDSQCIESGEKVEINFCPFCGKNLKE